MNNDKKSLEKVLSEAIRNASELSDANLMIGSPISTSRGTTIIPISNATIGFLTGGGEYGNVKLFSKTLPYSGASGGIVTIKPSGFLIEKGASIKFVRCPIDNFDKAIEYIETLTSKMNENK